VRCASTSSGLSTILVSRIRSAFESQSKHQLTSSLLTAAADPYLSTFLEIVQRAAEISELTITITIFYTRGADDAYVLQARLPPNIQIRSGRPNIKEALDDSLNQTHRSIIATQSPKNGVVLAGCGPDQLMSSIYAAKASVSVECQKAVGGLELYAE
jgi:hypothetical protein